jgi:hypothetical protein
LAGAGGGGAEFLGSRVVVPESVGVAGDVDDDGSVEESVEKCCGDGVVA